MSIKSVNNPSKITEKRCIASNVFSLPLCILLSFFFALFAKASSSESSTGYGRLRLLNGDVLSGHIKEMDLTEEDLIFLHVSSRYPIHLNVEDIADFNAQQISPNDVDRSHRVRMTNGDILIGEIVSMLDDTLILSTAYAGRVELDRKRILLVDHLLEDCGIAFSGIGTADDWITQGDSVEFNQDRILVRSANEGLFHKLGRVPERLQLNLRLRSFANTMFNIYLFTPNVENLGNTNSYSLQTRPGFHVALLQSQAEGGVRHVNSLRWPDNLQGKLAHVEEKGATYSIYYDSGSASIYFYENDVMIGEFRNLPNLPEKGSYIGLQLRQNFPLEILDFSVREWDGIMPGSLPEMSVGRDHVSFRNGDMLSGEIMKIQPEGVSVRSEYGDMQIPMERIDRLTFLRHENEQDNGCSKMQVRIHDGSRFAMTPLKIADESLRAKTLNMGTVDIPMNAVRSLEFSQMHSH